MRLSRVLIVALALMVSPVAAAVCEMACGAVPRAGHHVPVAPVAVAASEHDAHAHHAHHSAPSPSESVVVNAESTGDVTVSLAAPECGLRTATPARLRTSFTDTTFSVVAITSPTVVSADSRYVSPLSVAAAPSPPTSPPHALVPLRI